MNDPIDHGTESGWKAHKRRGEDPCDDCVAASTAVRARRRADADPGERKVARLLARRAEADEQIAAINRRDALAGRGSS